MRHHGLIASLGTSALLLLSTLAILSIVSAIVAFHGFPGPSLDRSAEPLVLGDASAGGPAARGFESELVIDLRPPRASGDVTEGGVGITFASGTSEASHAATAAAGDPTVALAPAPTAPTPSDDPAAPSGDGDDTSSGSGGLVSDTVDTDALTPVTDQVGELLDDSVGAASQSLAGS